MVNRLSFGTFGMVWVRPCTLQRFLRVHPEGVSPFTQPLRARALWRTRLGYSACAVETNDVGLSREYRQTIVTAFDVTEESATYVHC